MTDYERGVEQASAIYKEVIREYVAENAKLRTQLADVTESMGRVEERCAKLRELLQRLFVEYRYLRVRPRKTYLQHEGRMRAIEKEMSELGVEVE